MAVSTRLCLLLAGAGALFAACSADGCGGSTPGQGGVGGAGASGGSGGTGNLGGTAGTAGTAGGAGTSGSAGSAGSAGTAGSAGAAGSGGASDAGSDAAGGSGGADAGNDAAGGAAGSDSGDTTPPSVVSTSPAGGSMGVVKAPSVSVTFDEPMLAASLTASTSGTTCSGSLQLSADNFATCVAMLGAPVPSAGNTVFSVTPAAALASLGSFKVRVTSAAKDAAGNGLASTYTTPSGFVVRYHHTITIDGNNDFDANETFTTSTTGYSGYAAWDEKDLFLGFKGPDVASGSATKFLVVYVSGSPGTTTGVTYNTQQPTLPFDAKWHVRWKANNTFTDALTWGTAWGAAGWTFTGKVFQTGDFIELRIPLADVGSPTSVKVHISMLNEQGGVEGSYAAMPATSFADGYDPNYAKYLSFDLTASVAPKASPVLP